MNILSVVFFRKYKFEIFHKCISDWTSLTSANDLAPFSGGS